MDPIKRVIQQVGGATYARGLVYATQGRAVVDSRQPGEIVGHCYGSGRNSYTETITYTTEDGAPDGPLKSFTGYCTCPVGTNCKHCVALVLVALELLPKAAISSFTPRASIETTPVAGWRRQMDNLFPAQVDNPEPLALEFDFTEPTVRSRGSAQLAASTFYTRAGSLKIRPLRIGKRGTWIKTGATWNDVRNHRIENVRPEQLRALERILSIHEAASPYTTMDAIRIDQLRSAILWDALLAAYETGIDFVDSHGMLVVLEDLPGQARFEISGDTSVRIVAGISHPSLDDPAHLLEIGQPAQAIAWRDVSLHLAPLDVPASPEWATLRKTEEGIFIPESGRQDFEEVYLPRLESLGWNSPDQSFTPAPPPKPVLHLVLRTQQESGFLRINYAWQWYYGKTIRRVFGRDDRAEDDIRRLVEPIIAGVTTMLSGPSFRERGTVTKGDAIRLVACLDELSAAGVVVEKDHPEEYREVQGARIAISATENRRDWLDLGVEVFVGDEQVTIAQLIEALTLNYEYLVLDDGAYVDLNNPELDKLRALLEEARNLTDARHSGIRVPKIRESWWAELLALGVVDAAENSWFTKVRETAAQEAEGTPVEIPLPPVQAELRPYQKVGFEWLARLRRAGLGGVLADDMGLGKTLQILSMILTDRMNDAGARGPWLVVAPTSVVPNWVNEAQRFTPQLSVAGIEETSKKRGSGLAQFANNDIIVTSYTLLRLDLAEYAALGISGLILDEAQNAKNHSSKTFAAAAALEAPSVFAVTGTPIENNLGELWSMFALTAPGLLGGPKRFKKAFRNPIETGTEEESAEVMAALKRRIAPFLLRRRKQNVALDLPEKQEQVLAIDLDPEHREIYDRHLQRERQRVLQLTEDLDEHRVEVLSALTRLRQLAIDPSLVEEQAQAPSSKINVLIPLLEEARAEGHRALVFSQFTRYLKKISRALDEAGISYCYLDGATANRRAVIDEFAEGDATVFLISLKAGGVGLNLTMADYAILMDPWWNPATEEQAVDRTHRIGQMKPVHVYRIVAKNTIEEKVLDLQSHKRELITGVLASGSAAPTKLTAEDLRALL